MAKKAKKTETETSIPEMEAFPVGIAIADHGDHEHVGVVMAVPQEQSELIEATGGLEDVVTQDGPRPKGKGKSYGFSTTTTQENWDKIFPPKSGKTKFQA